MTPQELFTAAHTQAVVINRSAEGRVHLLGRDRLDLMHRMSTNEVKELPVGHARQTVLTTAIARMVDAPWILNRGETAMMITGVGRATAVRRWLAGYIFFRDEVKLTDASAELGQLGVYGAQAAEITEALFPGAAALAENTFFERDGVIVWRGRALAGEGFTVIAPAAQVESLQTQLVERGARLADDATYNLLRLAAGQPEAGHELTEDYIPLETDLWGAVSFTKGCYIGQEIIARMESRGKLARRLAGVALSAPVEIGAKITAGGAEVGTITTAGVLPEVGPVALSVLKSGACELGTAVEVNGVGGVVRALPFVS